MNNSAEISLPVTKVITAITAATVANTDLASRVASTAVENAPYDTWAFVNSVPWSGIAAMLAAIYTMFLLSEWWWKKLWRPVLEYYGILTPKRTRIVTVEEYESTKDE